jgi:hypothetical protein
MSDPAISRGIHGILGNRFPGFLVSAARPFGGGA